MRHRSGSTDYLSQAAIDRDSKLINRLVSAGQFDVATDVYEKGSYSRSFAELTFGFQGLPGDIGPHVGVVGTSDSGSEIEGMILERGKFGAKVVRILYHNGDNPGSCFVGGNPDAETDGCKFLRGSGSVSA